MLNETEPDPSKIFVNGIDGATGNYLTPPTDAAKLAEILKSEPPSTRPALRTVPMAVDEEFDLKDGRSVGWSIVFTTDETTAIRGALEPLIAHRRSVFGNDKVKVFDYRSPEGVTTWLSRNGGVLARLNPEVIPFYVLLIGSPEKIKYPFQFLLSANYAVGRLSFDTADEYAAYVKSLICHETADALSLTRQKTVAYFGTRHAFDEATKLSCDYLIDPLVQGYKSGNGRIKPPIASKSDFHTLAYQKKEASKENLARLLHDPAAGRPALLFTASHGVAWDKGHALQLPAQGALLCQNWSPGPTKPGHYFAASDVTDEATLSGLVAFNFACYSAGTPLKDEFPRELSGMPPDIAAAPFVAALPKRLLSHPRGSALAVIGHVERALGYSIPVTQAGPHLSPFENCVNRLLLGLPVGYAVRDFPDIFRTMSADVTEKLQAHRNGEAVSDRELVDAWLQRTDARNYALLGDPAARIRASELRKPAAA